MEFRIALSILAADWLHLGREVRALNESDCDYIHYDVMDGKFVPEMSFGVTCMRPIRRNTSKKLDVHLMIEDPIRNVRSFAESGADLITFHIEAAGERTKETIDLIKSFGVVPGLSIKPATPAEALFPYLDDLGMVLVMSVEPGFGGQAFMPESLEKIRTLRKEIERRGLSVDIEVDGGINLETAILTKEAGANVFVSGSALFRGDLVENVMTMRALL